MGDTVAVHADGVDFILHSTRGQTVSPTAFSKLGIDPLKKKVLVVKSMQHFHAAFAPIAAEVVYVAAPGTLAWDFRTLPYTKVARPVWPLDSDPFRGKAERPW
jgi:microcystin degradation protein MlrC